MITIQANFKFGQRNHGPSSAYFSTQMPGVDLTSLPPASMAPLSEAAAQERTGRDRRGAPSEGRRPSSGGRAGASQREPAGHDRRAGYEGKPNATAGRLMGDLTKDPDLKLSHEQAAGIVGNLSHESGGFRAYAERGTEGTTRGGRGFGQWTGPRRREFENWSGRQGLNPRSYEASYGFLKHELANKESASLAAVRRARTVPEATLVFEKKFERAGVKAYGSRLNRAASAYASRRDSMINDLRGSGAGVKTAPLRD